LKNEAHKLQKTVEQLAIMKFQEKALEEFKKKEFLT